MILTKDELVRNLDALSEELTGMKATMHQVTEQLRPVEEVNTDVWSAVEYSQEELGKLCERVLGLRRDVISDL